MNYKLKYFDVRVLGEPIRQIFTFMGIPFEDCRIDTGTWTDLKNTYKWRQLPELEWTNKEGKTICLTQSAVICRYLANSYPSHCLMPSDPLRRCRCDEIVEAVQEQRMRVKPLILAKCYETDGASKIEKLLSELTALDGDFMNCMNNLEELVGLCQNEGISPGDFIHGGELSWADFFLANFTSFWEEFFERPQLFANMKNIKKQYMAVHNLPKIKVWIEKRPKTII